MKRNILLSSLILFIVGIIFISNAVIAYNALQSNILGNFYESIATDYDTFARFEFFIFSLCFGLVFIAFSIFVTRYRRVP